MSNVFIFYKRVKIFLEYGYFHLDGLYIKVGVSLVGYKQKYNEKMEFNKLF